VKRERAKWIGGRRRVAASRQKKKRFRVCARGTSQLQEEKRRSNAAQKLPKLAHKRGPRRLS